MLDRQLTINEVTAVTALARSTIYNLISRGEFPAPVKPTRKSARWPESDIAAWLKRQRERRDAAIAPQPEAAA